MDKREEKVFFDIHKDLPREGPGNFESTERAYNSIKKYLNKPMILDIGCGPGMQTIDLLKISDGNVTAIDKHQPYIRLLKQKIVNGGYKDRAKAQLGNMFNLGFDKETFDLIWCESAIYTIGFEKGLIEFGKYLKRYGFMAVTEVCWLTNMKSKEVQEFWNTEYPQIKSVEENLNLVQKSGYEIIDHFVLSSNAWMNDYYFPLKQRLDLLKLKYKSDPQAMNVITLHEREMEIFEKYNSDYGYVFFIIRKSLLNNF